MARHAPRFLQIVEEARARIHEVNVADVKRKLEEKAHFHLVDVREESEWAGGHLPGAIHLGKGVIERDIEQRIGDLDAEIVCYCGGGYRSALVAENLQRMGYRNVHSMAGGYRRWREEGLPVE